MAENALIEAQSHDPRDIEGLVTFLRQEATKSRDQYLDEERANALDAYNGLPYGDEEEGRSQVVTRDVAEVVDYMAVSLLRTMVSGDKVVEFEHSDKRVAEEATAAVSREFMQGQDGYRFLHDWIKAGLLEKVSVAKVSIEAQPPKRREAEMPAEGIAMLMDQGVQIIAAEPLDETETAFRVAWAEEQPPKFRDFVSPNEETGIAADARDLDDDCPYLGFRTPKTLSEISDMGYIAEDLSDDETTFNANILTLARNIGNMNQFWHQGWNRDGVNRKVWFREEYCTYDLNGDGIAERLLVHRVGNSILINAETGEPAVFEVDNHPGVAWCPFPMPHRIIGQSLADKVMDIQRTRSVLMRQGLDNIYQTNAPRVMVPEEGMGDTTIDDLLTVRAGGIVRYRGPNAPTPIVVPFAAQAAFEVMEVMTGEKETRTGITRLNQGLDADALNKTATGTALMQAQGQQMEEYLARNFAEAFARLMLKKFRLMRSYGRVMDVMIDGEVRKVDPRQWPDDMQTVVRVGLGSGRKEQRLQYRTMLLEIAQAAVQNGSRIFTDENIYNNVKGIVADANLGSVRELITDPSTLQEQPEKPDPQMAKVQADAMLQANKQDQERKAAEADALLKYQQMKLDAEMRQQQLDYDLQAAREKAALDESLARDKAVFEANLAKEQSDREYDLALRRMELDRHLAERKEALSEQDDIPNKRPGGDLDK